ncbi:MAG: hypothetical protein WBQ50_16770 [Nocardioides sp.]
MFDTSIDELDARGAAAAIDDAHRRLVAVECEQLQLAAHWIDLHATEVEEPAGVPGGERTVRVGSDGTPWVPEFAAAEFAALQDLHPQGGAALLRKVANLRDRHPLLWARVLAGEVRAWKALETARLVGRNSSTDAGLDRESARWVDQETHASIDTLPWTGYLDLVERTIIAADPRAAEVRRLVAETTQGVWTTRSTDHGLKTLVARAAAGDVIHLVAVVDRLADILAVRGDQRPVGPRRADALALLAQPAHALKLLLDGTAQQPLPDEPASEADESHRPAHLDVPHGLADALSRTALDHTTLDRLVPRAVLHVHLDHSVLTSDGLGAIGTRVADVEGVGPVSLEQVRRWLGHRRVTVKPVLDPLREPAVDAYVFPQRLRDAVRAISRRDVFPFAVNTRISLDLDHVQPYVPPDRGGPPGMTGIDNAAPMVRHHHRLKTHSGWRLRQLAPGAHLWTSPHGHHWLTDPRGTRRLPDGVVTLIERGLRETRAA